MATATAPLLKDLNERAVLEAIRSGAYRPGPERKVTIPKPARSDTKKIEVKEAA